MSAPTRAFVASSLAALVGAALLHLLVLAGQLQRWPAMVHLALLGWATGMIFAVSYHTMPRFAARDFPYPRLIGAHWVTFSGGVALAAAPLGNGQEVGILGLVLEGVAALLFVANTLLLFLRGREHAQPAPLPATTIQAEVDRSGTLATQGAALCLPIALVLLLLVRLRWIAAGWLLAAEHLVVLGWLMLMMVGVAYHVLPRFSQRRVRGAGWARAQVALHGAALAVMIPALGFGWTPLFPVGGILMALAIGLFAWTVWPTLEPLRPQPVPVRATHRGGAG